ncbi:MAG: hypothetical protein IPI35_02805 [Deltaproteobacteria bacterium]|nr:hypothetical protein [Deltaproteobacteria bacterium]
MKADEGAAARAEQHQKVTAEETQKRHGSDTSSAEADLEAVAAPRVPKVI